MKLVIIEGPAGSGKSTLISEIEAKKLGQLVPSYRESGLLPRPGRSFDGIQGVQISQLKDAFTVMQIAELLRSNGKTNKPLVIDRWLISQLVYDNIRHNRTSVNFHTVKGLLNTHFLQFPLIMLEYFYRNGEPEIWMTDLLSEITFDFLIIMPTPDVLLARRQWAGKEYPYSVLTELDWYQAIAKSLWEYINSGYPELITQIVRGMSIPLTTITVKAHPVTIKEVDSFGRVLEMTTWM